MQRRIMMIRELCNLVPSLVDWRIEGFEISEIFPALVVKFGEGKPKLTLIS